MPELDLKALRKQFEQEADPEWLKLYGKEAWAAALELIGEQPLNPNADGMVEIGQRK